MDTELTRVRITSAASCECVHHDEQLQFSPLKTVKDDTVLHAVVNKARDVMAWD